MFLPSILRPLPGDSPLLSSEVADRPFLALDGARGRFASESLMRDLSSERGRERCVWLRLGTDRAGELEDDLRAACRRVWFPESDSGADLPELLADPPRGSCIVFEIDGHVGVEVARFIEQLVTSIEPGRPQLIVVAESGHPACLGDVLVAQPEGGLSGPLGQPVSRFLEDHPAFVHDLRDAARLWGTDTVIDALESAHGVDSAAEAVARALVRLLSETQRDALGLAVKAGYWHPQLIGGGLEPLPGRPWMIELEDGWWWVRPVWRSALSAVLAGPSPAPPAAGVRPSAAPPMVLDVRMLGPLEVRLGGHPVNGWSGKVGVNVLRYLLSRRDRSCPRDELLAVFWPEVDPAVARNRLQVAVSALRRGFREVAADPVVEHCDGMYRISPRLSVVTDVAEFVETAEAARRADREGELGRALTLYAEAARLYRGDMAPDVPYEEWCLLLRESYRIRLVDVLDRLCALLKEHGRIDECIAFAHRLLELDPCREDAHRLLMWCYARQGRPHQATRQYEFCSRVLGAMLDMRPSSETTGLLRTIRQDARTRS